MTPLQWALGGAVLGAIIGSFIATLVLRWPKGRGLGGRSCCDACGKMLRTWELVPLASFAMLRGRCSNCRAAIDWRHPMIEAACVLVGGLAVFVAPGLEGLLGAVFGWTLVALAALDTEEMWLPDALTLPLAVAGLAAAFSGAEPDLKTRAIGLAAGFGGLWLLAFLYRLVRKREGLGGGDPKLLGAIGAWIGWQVLPLVLVAASLIGLLSVVVRMLRGEKVSATDRLPLGALMAVAAFPAWLLGR